LLPHKPVQVRPPTSASLGGESLESWSEKARRRNFQIWEYHASHGCLLLRSPKGPDGGPGATTNLDLLCFDVAYMELPKLLNGLDVAQPTPEEAARVGRALERRADPWSLRILVSGGRRYAVAAGKFVEEENDKELMASFLATRLRMSGASPLREKRAASR
jgi:hypothetical protein